MLYKLNVVDFIYKQISLKIYVPDAFQVQQQYKQEKDSMPFPFWSKIWPAAFALSQFLIDNHHYIDNKKVEEFAAGLALPSLVASSYASSVHYSDHMPEAIDIAKQSVQLNKLKNISGNVVDWKQHQHATDADVVLISDLNYEPQNFDALYRFLLQLINTNVTVILSTPQRLMAKTFIEKLLPFTDHHESIDIIEHKHLQTIAVLVLRIPGK